MSELCAALWRGDKKDIKPILKQRKEFACFLGSSDTLPSAHAPTNYCFPFWLSPVEGGNLALLGPGGTTPERVGIPQLQSKIPTDI